MDTIEKKLNEEKEKAHAIREKSREQFRNQTDIVKDYHTRCVPHLDTIFTAILSNEQQTTALIAGSNCVVNVQSDERVQQIRQYLKNGKFEEVAQYVIQLDALVGHQNEWRSLAVNEQIFYFVTLLQTYLFDDYVRQ